jgi:hypothetical protein
MTQAYADLELALRWVEHDQALEVGLRFTLSDQPLDKWEPASDRLTIDLPTLARKTNDPDGYAAALTEMLFSRPKIKEFYTLSRASAEDRPIHLRINVEARAPSVWHEVRWELLRDCDTSLPIATSDRILFSRYLSSPDFHRIPWRTKQVSRALVVIAGPKDLEKYTPGGRQLAEVEVGNERSYAEEALGDIDTEYLAGPGEATLANMARKLEEQVDILYLVCHGGINSDVPFILLEKADGTADPVDGRQLAEVIASRTERPTLAVLNSCQSASEGGVRITTDERILAGLGPRLAGAGIATVIGMQGNVSMETAQLFAKTFFTELRNDGVVDRAGAVARRALKDQDRPDWWRPVLFSRLRSGRTYFKAEFTKNSDETWATLKTLRRTRLFTPVLGPGMTDAIIGPREGIAHRWVERWQMPIVIQNRADLAKVAQYLRVQQKVPGAVVIRVIEELQDQIAARIIEAEPDDPFYGLDTDLEPHNVIMQAGHRMLDKEDYSYRTVAAMDVPVFITTNWTQLLEQALSAPAAGKKPKTVYFPWKDQADWPEESYDGEPTSDEPMVYHLFGRLEDPYSLVLTEDDYFEWLTAWVSKQALVPKIIGKSLTKRSLLFLGYRLDDWEFRSVFQALKSFSASQHSLAWNTHVGVQFGPSSEMVEPEAAQDYLESYFGQDKVSIYWAETQKFLDEYRRRTAI